MSCPGTDWTVPEARLNRRQQATVEKEHDTKSSGIRRRWDLEPGDRPMVSENEVEVGVEGVGPW